MLTVAFKMESCAKKLAQQLSDGAYLCFTLKGTKYG